MGKSAKPPVKSAIEKRREHIQYATSNYSNYIKQITKFREALKTTSFLDKILKRTDFDIKLQSESITKKAFQYSTKEQKCTAEFDMLAIAAMVDVEPIVERVHDRIHSLFIKNDFSFVIDSPNISALDKLNTRFVEMMASSGISMKQLVIEILYDWVLYSNAFLIKRRDILTGKSRFKNIPKVSYYERVHPALVCPVSEKGKVTGWLHFQTVDAFKRQNSLGVSLDKIKKSEVTGVEYIVYTDMVHIHRTREAGFVFAKPRAANVEDDVRMLRQVEENVHMYLLKHIFPLLHVKVGTEAAPADFFEDGMSEVDYALGLIQNMPSEGMIVTPERYDIDVLKTDSGINALEFINTFKARLLIDLGVSPVDMGEASTSNRSTADTVSENLKDRIKAEQLTFSEEFASKIILDILLDENVKVTEALSVALFFNEIDVLTQIKKQNHITDLFNNNLINETEARDQMGLQKMTPLLRKNTHFNLHTLPIAQLKSFMPPSDGAVATKNQPENQHGKNQGPDPKKSSEIIEELFKDIQDDEIKQRIYSRIRNLLNGNETSE